MKPYKDPRKYQWTCPFPDCRRVFYSGGHGHLLAQACGHLRNEHNRPEDAGYIYRHRKAMRGYPPIPKLVNWKITFWIHGAGRVCRGTDMLEASEELAPADVEELMEEDLNRNLICETSFTPNLPNFHRKHQELMFESRHTSVSNFGVLSLKEVKR